MRQDVTLGESDIQAAISLWLRQVHGLEAKPATIQIKHVISLGFQAETQVEKYREPGSLQR